MKLHGLYRLKYSQKVLLKQEKQACIMAIKYIVKKIKHSAIYVFLYNLFRTNFDISMP